MGALTLVALAPSGARAQPRVVLAGCDESTTHIDRALLAQLLAVELGEQDVTVEIDAALCDADASHLEVRLTAPDRFVLERVPVLGDDPADRARGLALVIAERVHLLTLPATASPEVDERASDALELPDAPSDPALPDAPRAVVPTPPAEPPAPPPPTPQPLPPTLEVVALARLAPVTPSGVIGLRTEVHAHAHRHWSLSLGVTATWSHAQHSDVSPHILVGALSGSVGWTPYRDRFFDMLIAARGELGVALVGGQGVSETALPWATLGADAALLLWPHPTLGVVLEMGVSGVLAGTGVYTMFGEPVLQLAGLVLDLTLGFRVPLE